MNSSMRMALSSVVADPSRQTGLYTHGLRCFTDIGGALVGTRGSPVTDARERIVEAAYELFTRRGIPDVGVDEVIARAGVAKATLYRHFRSKDELVLAFLDRCDVTRRDFMDLVRPGDGTGMRLRSYVGQMAVSELDEVLEALEGAGDDVALATIVDVRGSTYRREGARLVVLAEGTTVGNISGGCLEGDIAVTAQEVLASRRPQVLHFDLTADDEAVWGWGLGCNGAIDVLVEPASNARPFVAALRTAAAKHRLVALVTVVEGPATGSRLVVHPQGKTEGDLGDAARTAALEALAAGRSSKVVLEGGLKVFVEVLEPPLHLVVCGAGHDAMPVVEFGARLGWRVDVVDDRRAMLTSKRFPHAGRLVHSQPAVAADSVGADERTCVVVMSHNFLRDAAYLGSFLSRAVSYLGVLGPASRLHRLLGTLAREGLTPTSDELPHVYGPAGLDLGADGPEEIAWAIVAEILAVQRKARAGFLRDRGGPIHPRVAMESAS